MWTQLPSTHRFSAQIQPECGPMRNPQRDQSVRGWSCGGKLQVNLGLHKQLPYSLHPSIHSVHFITHTHRIGRTMELVIKAQENIFIYSNIITLPPLATPLTPLAINLGSDGEGVPLLAKPYPAHGILNILTDLPPPHNTTSPLAMNLKRRWGAKRCTISRKIISWLYSQARQDEVLGFRQVYWVETDPGRTDLHLFYPGVGWIIPLFHCAWVRWIPQVEGDPSVILWWQLF